MDQNNDGNADVQALVKMVDSSKLYIMIGGDTAEQEQKALHLNGFKGAFPLKAYRAKGNMEDVKRIIEEEVMHFLTLRGWFYMDFLSLARG